MPTSSDFVSLDLRVGTVIDAAPFPEARVPAIKLRIDFGPELGTRASSAQLTRRYTSEQMMGKQVVAVVNIGTRRIAGFTSEVLVLGAAAEEGDVVLLAVDKPVANGTRVS
jgi:tRNA-binding protein